MKIIQRFGYYLGGFSIGLVLLAFILNGKNVSCSYAYGPEARVLKNINLKKLVITPLILKEINTRNLDSTIIYDILKNGDVVFSKSDTRKKPCGIYYLESESDDEPIDLKIQNCDSTATITEIIWK